MHRGGSYNQQVRAGRRQHLVAVLDKGLKGEQQYLRRATFFQGPPHIKTTLSTMTSDTYQPNPSSPSTCENARPIPLHVIFLLFRIRQMQHDLQTRLISLRAELRETRPFRGGPAKGDIKQAQGILTELDRFSYLLLRALSCGNVSGNLITLFTQQGQLVMDVTPRVQKPELVGTCRF